MSNLVTLTWITISGKPLPDELRWKLNTLGDVKVFAQLAAKVIYAPPPVDPLTDKFRQLPKGAIEAKMVLRWLEDGITLLSTQSLNVLIRVHSDTIQIYDGELFAALGKTDFMEILAKRPERFFFASLRGFLDEMESKAEYGLKYIVPPVTAPRETAVEWMNWNGFDPNAHIPRKSVPRPLNHQPDEYYVQETGNFPANRLLQKIKEGVKVISYLEGGTFIRIVATEIYIYQQINKTDRGLYGVLDLETFLELYKAEQGGSIIERITNLFHGENKNVFLQGPEVVKLLVALDLLNWYAISPNGTSSNQGLLQSPPLYVHIDGSGFTGDMLFRLNERGFTHFAEGDEFFVSIQDYQTHVFVGGKEGRYAHMYTSAFWEAVRNSRSLQFPTILEKLFAKHQFANVQRKEAFAEMGFTSPDAVKKVEGE